MKKTNIFYWIFTALMTLFFGIGSIPNMISSADSVALFQHLGYPLYILPFIGTAKLLGLIVILAPGYPRLKEWAYAGFVIDITGAMYSSFSVGDPAPMWLSFLIGHAVIAGSYVFYHKRLRERSAAAPQ